MQNISLEDLRKIFELKEHEPSLSQQNIADKLHIAKSTVNKYLNLAKEQNLANDSILAMDEEELSITFNLKSRQKDFIQPNWENVRKYVQVPRQWAKKLNTLANAWQFLYIEIYFPSYKYGKLPFGCMSERTFERRFKQYKRDNGLDFTTKSSNPNLQFGPGSVVECDCIGDRITFIDKDGNEHSAVLFTAVLKYSGYTFVYAMPCSTSEQWSYAIIKMCKFYGGTPEVFRTDNDSAIAIHGNKKLGTKPRIKPDMQAVINHYNMVVDLCPPRRPEIKGSNERTNRTLQQELFADPKYQITGYRFNSYDELNEAIAQDLLRFNNKPRKGNQLSRFAAFEKVEKEHLKDLPLFDPIYKKLFTKTVGKDGYITFNSHHYQVGTSYAEKEVTVEDYLGEKLRLFDSKTLDLIGEHTISHDMVTSSKYHKLNSLKTEKEKIVSRDRDWFISAFASFEADDENIPKLINLIFDSLKQSKPVAARICNKLWRYFTNTPGKQDAFKQACRLALTDFDIKKFEDRFKHYFKACKDTDIGDSLIEAFEQSAANKAKQPTSASNTTHSHLRGISYVQKLTRKDN